MHQLNTIARVLLSPTALLTTIWFVVLASVLIGPIHYPSLPSIPAFLLIGIGLAVYFTAHCGGVWSCAQSLRRRPGRPATLEVLNLTVGAASIAGLLGIALMALDRTVLSGVSNSGYAALLRCAPALVDYIEIKRTFLLYLGYLSFSFGFVSLTLFVLRGEDIKGGAAYLAQLSIMSPVGYALLYAGRTPILLMIALIVAAVLVRLAQGLRPLPQGHHLLAKVVVLGVLFGIYANGLWWSRQKACIEMEGVVRELLAAMQEQRAKARQSVKRKIETRGKQPTIDVQTGAANATRADADLQGSVSTSEQELVQPSSRSGIDAAAVSTMIEGVAPRQAPAHAADFSQFLDSMRISWHVAPRQYVLSAVEHGYLSPSTARGLLSNYFYLTHGVRTLDVIWQSRAQLSPLWGVYEIGILSPILRLFFPGNQLLERMNEEHSQGDIYGFFPTVWGAAFIDFGAWGAPIYIVIWGFLGGWAHCGTKRSALATPPLLLSFTIASIVLSPLQGPLGIANSALVLASILVTGYWMRS